MEEKERYLMDKLVDNQSAEINELKKKYESALIVEKRFLEELKKLKKQLQTKDKEIEELKKARLKFVFKADDFPDVQQQR